MREVFVGRNLPMNRQSRAGVPPACVGEADALLALACSRGRRDACPTMPAIPVQGFNARIVSGNCLPEPERCSWHFSPRTGKPIGAMGARHSCRFSVNHSLVSAGGQTFWTMKRRKRRAPVSRSHQFNYIVPLQEQVNPQRLDAKVEGR